MLDAERKDDIGRMLMTTSEATSGATPRDAIVTEESKDNNVNKESKNSPVKQSHEMDDDHSFGHKNSSNSETSRGEN